MLGRKLSLRTIQKTASEVGKEYGVKRIYLFGSYARGEATSKSDIDLRIDPGQIRGFFALSGFYLALQKKLGKKVDLLTTDSLDSRFLEHIRSEEKLIYAA